MDISLGLGLNCFQNAGMLISKGVDRESAKKIEILFTVPVRKHAAFAANNIKRQALVGLKEKVVFLFHQGGHWQILYESWSMTVLSS
jgi:hypothetical protein